MFSSVNCDLSSLLNIFGFSSFKQQFFLSVIRHPNNKTIRHECIVYAISRGYLLQHNSIVSQVSLGLNFDKCVIIFWVWEIHLTLLGKGASMPYNEVLANHRDFKLANQKFKSNLLFEWLFQFPVVYKMYLKNVHVSPDSSIKI